MPQTRFVLKRPAAGLKPVVVINESIGPMPRRSRRRVLDLLIDVGVGDDALDFPCCSRRAAPYACRKLDDRKTASGRCSKPSSSSYRRRPVHEKKPADARPTLDYNDYVGRIAIGQCSTGSSDEVDVWLLRANSQPSKIVQLYGFQGVRRIEMPEVGAGDIAAVAGLANVSIGDTISITPEGDALPVIPIDQPVISMLFAPNQSPLAGREGKYVTARQVQCRLVEERETNVAR